MATRLLVFLLVCAVSALLPVGAQTMLSRAVLGSGASDMSNSTARITGTAGQVVAGPVLSPTHIVGQGFWFQLQSVTTSADDFPQRAAVPILHQNYPNPFNPSTLITFSLPTPAHVRLQLYRASGRLLAILVDETLSAGLHRIRFEAGDLAAGMYIVRLISGETHATQKMLLMK